MRKSHIKATAVLLAAILLGGCAKQGNEHEPGAEISSNLGVSNDSSESNISTDAGTKPENSTSSTTTSSEPDDNISSEPSLLDGLTEEELRQKRRDVYSKGSYVDITPETSWLIEDFKRGCADPVCIDGGTIDLSKALRACGNQDETYALRFDFAFLRYTQPVFCTTFEEPNLYNWETRQFSDDYSIEVSRSDFFKVEAGDVLENGLTVKEADYWLYKQGGYIGAGVELSGEITLSGVLAYYNGEYEPGFDTDSVFFIPNPAETVMTQMSVTTGMFLLQEEKFAAVLDGVRIDIGYKSDCPVDLSDVFKESNCVKAKVTLKDISISDYDGMNYRNRAKLVSVDELL